MMSDQKTELELLRRLEKHTRKWFKASGGTIKDSKDEYKAQTRMVNVLRKLKKIKTNKKQKKKAAPKRHESSEHEKIAMVKSWACDRDWFDTGFIDNLQEAYERFGHLTDSQERALDNIIDKFEIW